MGIAIPKWIVEGKNNIWVLGFYGIVFGGALPALVVGIQSIYLCFDQRPYCFIRADGGLVAVKRPRMELTPRRQLHFSKHSGRILHSKKFSGLLWKAFNGNFQRIDLHRHLSWTLLSNKLQRKLDWSIMRYKKYVEMIHKRELASSYSMLICCGSMSDLLSSEKVIFISFAVVIPVC